MSNKVANLSFCSMVADVKSSLIVTCIVFSFGCFFPFLNDSIALKINSSNCSFALIRFTDSAVQNTPSEVILMRWYIVVVLAAFKWKSGDDTEKIMDIGTAKLSL